MADRYQNWGDKIGSVWFKICQFVSPQAWPQWTEIGAGLVDDGLSGLDILDVLDELDILDELADSARPDRPVH